MVKSEIVYLRFQTRYLKLNEKRVSDDVARSYVYTVEKTKVFMECEMMEESVCII